jgi:hypothetical protein
MVDHPFARCYDRRLQLANEDAYRLGLAQRFAYVLPQPNLLNVIKRYSPLVELGAGTGYWAYLLRLLGANVVAYDIAPLGGRRSNRYHGDVRPWSEVLEGDVTAVSRHVGRSLFLCWPPRYSNIWESLNYYRGNFLLYIGDRGVRTAQLSALDRDFALLEAHLALAMDGAAGTRVQLSVWRRRNGGDNPAPIAGGPEEGA